MLDPLSKVLNVGSDYSRCDNLPGTKGTVTCFASYLVCTSIFNSIMALAGNINVRLKF